MPFDERHKVSFCAFLPLPEMITKSESLRPELSFLGSRGSLWTKFYRILKGYAHFPENLFVRGIGRLKWALLGDNLYHSINHLTKYDNYYIRCRVPIPLVAHKERRECFKDIFYNLVHSVRIYPSLFVEYRLSISTSAPLFIDEEYVKSKKTTFQSSIGRVKRAIEHLLFDKNFRIRRRFSSTERIDLVTRGANFDDAESYELDVLFEEPRTTIILGGPSRSKKFKDRLLYAATLPFAHRVTFTSIWNVLLSDEAKAFNKMYDMVYCLLYTLNPKWHINDEYSLVYCLPSSYLRHVYQKIASAIKLKQKYEFIRDKLQDFTRTLSISDALALANLPHFIRDDFTSILQKVYTSDAELHMEGPLLTVFDYLLFAFLRDGLLMQTNPQRYRIPDDRLGSRSANQIDKGSNNLAKKYNGMYTRVKRSELYPVPGKTLETLRNLGLIEYLESNMTSASLSFRISLSNPYVLRRLVNLRKALSNKYFFNLGV